MPIKPEAVARSLREAYVEGWISARHWPNQQKPWPLDVTWRVDEEKSTVVFTIKEQSK